MRKFKVVGAFAVAILLGMLAVVTSIALQQAEQAPPSIEWNPPAEWPKVVPSRSAQPLSLRNSDNPEVRRLLVALPE